MPAVGAPPIYTVAASVVVTLVFVAESIGAANELNVSKVAVPLAAVLVSCEVDEDTWNRFPLAPHADPLLPP